MSILSKDRRQELVESAVKKLYANNKQMAELNVESTKLKETLQQYMMEKKIKEVTVDVAECEVNGYPVKKIKALLVEKLTVNYDEDKLKQNLDPEVFNEIIEKVYSVINFDLLKKLFKKAGYSVDQLKQCVSSKTYIVPARIQQLYSVGDITKQDMKNAYTARIDKHIKISSVK